MKWFGFRLKSKKKKGMEPSSPEELLFTLYKEYEESVKEIHFQFDSKKQELEESLQKALENRKEWEKNISFAEMILDSDKGIVPLVYELITSGKYAKEYRFSRGKFTLNPYHIHVIHYTNCIFLHAYHSDDKEAFITLYYDKVKNSFDEYRWTLPVDFVLKQQIKLFLFDLLKDVLKDRLFQKDKYISEFRASEKFILEMKNMRDELWVIYDEKINIMEKECDDFLHEKRREYESSLKPLEEKVRINKEAKEKKENDDRLLHHAKSISLLLPDTEFFSKKKLIVHDEEVKEKMKSVFLKVHELVSADFLMDAESRHDVTALYEKDIHELWYSFMQLDEDNQKKEKNRFLSLLNSINGRLDFIENRIKAQDEIDFEKKMRYMERKFKTH